MYMEPVYGCIKEAEGGWRRSNIHIQGAAVLSVG